MNDDDEKKPRRGKPARMGEGERRGPRASRPGEGGGRAGKPFRKRDDARGEGAEARPKTPFRKREDGEAGPRAARPGGRPPRAEASERPRKRFERSGDAAEGGERPFRRERPQAARREGDEGLRAPRATGRSGRPPHRDGSERPHKRFERSGDAAESGNRPLRRGPRAGFDADRPAGFKRPRPGSGEGGRPPRDGANAGRPAAFKRPRPGGPGVEDERFRRPAPWRERGEGAEARGPRPGRRERESGEEARKPFAGRPRRDDDGERPQRSFSKDGARRERSDDRPRRDFAAERPRGDRPRKPFGADRAAPEAVEAGERIAKRLARAGIASRRDAEELIAAGRVAVNGRPLDSPAVNVMPGDRITVDGTEIPAVERTRLFLFHKPSGVVTTNRDPEGRRTVFDVLPESLPRLVTVGRLDINTEGLLLLTNDGGLARVLELPSTGWLRRYRARVHGRVDEKALSDLREGIAVDGVFYGSVEASLEREQGSNAWLSIGLREGKNREVKNILGALGLEVSRLIRVSFGPFQLGELAEGEVQEIRGRMLRDQLGERLIEEAGADFEAPVAAAFPNRPVRKGRDEPEAPRPRPVRAARAPIGEGGLIKARKRREEVREEALGRLSTRPERGTGPRGDFERRPKGEGERRPRGEGEREGRTGQPPRKPRTANVWRAPGSRPRADGETPMPREGKPPRKGAAGGSGKAGAKRPFKPRGEGPDGPRPSGPKGPRKGKPGADRRR